MTVAVAAVDLGATSGRVMLGHVGPNELRLGAVNRFANTPVRTIDGLHWNVLELYRNSLAGIAAAVRQEPGLVSVGVDAWACDYGLLRGDRLLGSPFHYRDERNPRALRETEKRVSSAELYSASGLQYLPFNTVYQLVAEQTGGLLELADSFLLLPDLINYWLTGKQFAEKTNASTTSLLGVHTGEWDQSLIQRLGLPPRIFPELIQAGSTVGPLLPAVAAEIGIGIGGSTGTGSQLTVTAVGSHDTASAVVAIPSTANDFAYISCGTWSLVGVELEHPVVTEAGRQAGFTNEGGVDGRVRYLHNVMGLWLLNECVRTWEQSGERVDLAGLLRQAHAVTSRAAVFDPDDTRFLAPGDMPERIAAVCREQDLPVPDSRAALVRSILESLADAYARTLDTAALLTGKSIAVVHLVGGGSQNELLCQLTADRSGLTVLAGPMEATAIGNVLVQARAQGLVSGDLDTLRALVARRFPPLKYTPHSH